MLEIHSDYYVKYIETESNRLDFVFHHPQYDIVKQIVELDTHKDLGELIIPDSMHQGLMASGKENGKIPFISIENLESDGTVNLTTVKYIDDAPEWRLLQVDDVLFSRSRLIGVCAVISEDSINTICGSYIFFFKVNKEKILPKFLTKFINSRIGQMQVEYLQTGSSGNNMNIEETKKMRIFDLPIIKQQDILDKISLIECQIQPIEDKIKKAKENAVLIMLNELGISIPSEYHDSYFFKTGKDERSPFFITPFNKISDRFTYLFYDTRLNLIDSLMQKYSTTTLEKISKTRKGEQPDYVDDGILAIKTIDLKDGYIDYDKCLQTSIESHTKFTEAQVKKGDILIASTGYVSLGKVDVYDKDYKAMASQDISIVSLQEGYDPYFIAYFLRTMLGKIQFEKWWTGSSGQIHLQDDDLKKIIIPDNTKTGLSIEKQIEIAKKITDAMYEITILEQQKKEIANKAVQQFEKLTKSKQSP